MKKAKSNSPKVLLLDIETAPILAYVWGLWDNNVALNQIERDWSILSWSAKWLDDPESKIMYEDQRKAKDIENDKKLLVKIHKLIDEADIVISQNGIKFDIKKLNARFIHHGMTRPSSFRHIDTLKIAKKHFAFTSNKLEYMANKLGVKHKKLKTKKFQGFELWKACLYKNQEAFKEMELYNKQDVLVLQDVYKALIPWDNSINFNVYNEHGEPTCTCGSTSFLKRGYRYTNTGKFQRYRCNSCGKETTDGVNLIKDSKFIKR